MTDEKVRKKVLRLTIEVPDLYADDLDEAAAIMSEKDALRERLASTLEWAYPAAASWHEVADAVLDALGLEVLLVKPETVHEATLEVARRRHFPGVYVPVYTLHIASQDGPR